MMQVQLAPDAIDDLEKLWNFIAADSVQNASRYLDQIEAKLRFLSVMPGVGRIRDDVAANGVRSYAFRSHVILYRLTDDTVRVLRVVQGARDIRRVSIETR